MRLMVLSWKSSLIPKDFNPLGGKAQLAGPVLNHGLRTTLVWANVRKASFVSSDSPLIYLAPFSP
jgi:hypothetical protein